MTTSILLMAGLLLAFANGANDNFKGVATLFGSGTADYRRTLAWATATTLFGSLMAVVLAQELLARFGGKGLVPDELVGDPAFLASVALAAGVTVLLATRIGMPISTTHALVGALVGAGLGSASVVRWASLGRVFLAPLLFSPLVALVGSALLFPALRRLSVRMGASEETCFCVGVEPTVVDLSTTLEATAMVPSLTGTVGPAVECRERFDGRALGVQVAPLLDALHYLSAGLVSFARGLNDAPQIAALLLAVPRSSSLGSIVLCGAAIALGGLRGAQRVAETMSHRITTMTAGQGFAANLVTGALVVAASRWGLPVSTTHVSCGSLFGLGLAGGRTRWGLIGKVLLAWFITLPTAAALAWVSFVLLHRLRLPS
ncbi:MAG: inorganic phosphate transporter [Planctomycetota bacterium]|nr:inorganic phosphate transporter [Planctomycetota bacterium]